MKIFGLDISRAKVVEELSLTKAVPSTLNSVNSYGASWSNWFGPILESFTGAWQRNVTVDPQTSLLAFSAVFSCITGIAGDIAKLRIKLDIDADGIWEEITNPHGNAVESTLIRVLKKPNSYQNRIKFIEQWIVSKLLYGNAYVLKERDRSRATTERPKGPVVAMYVLHPNRVTPLVADDGSVWYQIGEDYLSGVDEQTTVPASEIIHDMMVSLWHPLVGVSPIYACGVSATMGNKIQGNSTTFFNNLSRPGGMLSSPGHISDEAAARLKAIWETNFGGQNVGKIAIAGDGLKFEPFTMPATDAQLIEQLRWTVEDVARAFHYPISKLTGSFPPYASTPEALTMGYYTDCLQTLIESVELCLDEGLELPTDYHTELDLDNLLRMDTAALYDANNKAVGGGWMAPDEARFKANFGPVPGGSSPMMQQQNWSLAQLANRSGPADAAAAVVPLEPSNSGKEAPIPKMNNDEIETEAELWLRRHLSGAYS